ncbi:PfkB family carbohydrate kinase [Xylanimonas protaetiae]|uniref:Bifunctional heptose 7-phosphate kinase/heptose 1-phosphate adenyltransferase n=1 Tax=Xylanimonas protaetiae TaxID=2509457 RepID=A0A4P6FKL1_9MICO|nr:PfkB family carbohydrate kinase [Xylanimonas protaetiae]QAY71168.1 bifunctional heptose 7-phosphate kinase/heptose 1-phosphate adenyltransferase [Xylanimonas protaetiae]
MSRTRIVVVGDVLLDRDVEGTVDRVTPDAPAPVLDVTGVHASPGGAGLAALLAAGDGADVTLVAPIANDPDGRLLTEQVEVAAQVVPLGHAGRTRTKMRVRSGGHTLVRLDDGGPGTPTTVPGDVVAELVDAADVVLVSDYGGGVTRDAELRARLTPVAGRVVWDPHPRGAPPVPGVRLATPNVAEARAALEAHGRHADGCGGPAGPERVAARLRSAWGCAALAVTAGAAGAYLADGGQVRFAPTPGRADGDPCGAGDRFAVSAALALARGAGAAEAVEQAVVDATGWVRAGGTAALHHRPGPGTPRPPGRAGESLEALAARLRARGGRLVATGGCFDLLHAGHVAMLQTARTLGGSLVVLLNSDASVRALKGPDRPVQHAADRARVLRALGCVDEVVVFDGPDPAAALARLRPDVWVKGGDYDTSALPERFVVEGHGGSVVLLPYVPGQSTTAILARSATGPRPDLEVLR